MNLAYLWQKVSCCPLVALGCIITYRYLQYRTVHCKKRITIFPSPAGMSPWQGIIKLFLAREGLVSDIPAGDGKIANLFFTVYSISMIRKDGGILWTWLTFDGKSAEKSDKFLDIFGWRTRIFLQTHRNIILIICEIIKGLGHQMNILLEGLLN
jgi:hypothetical protein